MPRSKELSAQMRAQSRAQILAAARRLFADRGYFACKVSEIASEAAMSQGNIYWYFSGKEAILKAILAEGFETIGAVLQNAESHPGSGLEKLTYAIEQYIILGRDGIDFFTIFMSLLSHGGTPFLEDLGFDTAQIGLGYHQRLSTIIAQAQSEGNATQVEPNILTMFFFAFFNGLIITYGAEWLDLHPQLIQDAVLRMLGSDDA
jgi:AcrR family transcriptional regulator